MGGRAVNGPIYWLLMIALGLFALAIVPLVVLLTFLAHCGDVFRDWGRRKKILRKPVYRDRPAVESTREDD